MLSKGQVVFSKAGNDKGLAFIIFSLDNTFAYLVNGKKRKLIKPKKKKLKHIQVTKFVNEEIKNKLENNLYILDSDIKKALLSYKN